MNASGFEKVQQLLKYGHWLFRDDKKKLNLKDQINLMLKTKAWLATYFKLPHPQLRNPKSLRTCSQPKPQLYQILALILIP